MKDFRHELIPLFLTLENNYYWSAKEAVQDFQTMFSNCFTYYEPGDDMILKANTMAKLFRKQLDGLPPEEVELEAQVRFH